MTTSENEPRGGLRQLKVTDDVVDDARTMVTLAGSDLVDWAETAEGVASATPRTAKRAVTKRATKR